MNETPSQTRSADNSDFKPLLDLATPELYERNAFRLLEVHVEATERDLAKRKQVMEAASRNKLQAPAGPCRILPRTPAPDDHEIRECSHAIQDAERRLAQEFFWFWPLAVGQAGNDAGLRLLHQGDNDGAAKTWRELLNSREQGPAAKHNLAILYHFAALEIENAFLDGKSPATSPEDRSSPSLAPAVDPQSKAQSAILDCPNCGQQVRVPSDKGSLLVTCPVCKHQWEIADRDLEKTADAEGFWSESQKYWKELAVEEGHWSRVVARIRAMDDRSLTTGAARRLERRLPVALTLIHARLAIRAFQHGQLQHAKRHVARIRASGFEARALQDALGIVVEPTRSTIRTLCEAARKEADADSTTADAVTDRLLDQTAGPLALLDLLLPEDHPALLAEHDQVAMTALSCQVAFGNKTDNWKRSLELLTRLGPLAASTAAKERVAHNLKTVQRNHELSLCWFCGQNQSNDQCTVEVPMHGEVEHTPIYNGTRTTWRTMTVKVSRCKACRDEASREGNIVAASAVGAILGVIAFFFMGTGFEDQLGFQPENARWAAAILALLLPIGLGLMAYSSVKKAERPGIKKREQNDYPRIKELLAEGWAFGGKPPGME